MKLEFSEFDNGVRLLSLTGMLDMEGVSSIDGQFTQHCSGDGVYVLVDLSQVTYLSSIGIPMLINSAKSVTEHGGKLAFVNPQANVSSLLEMTGVSHLIRIYPDVETARKSILVA